MSRVVERNRPYDTFGWGVVFSDQTLGNLRAADPTSAARSSTPSTTGTTSRSIFAARKITSSGHGFCGIGRKRLLNILQERCEELGVKLVFETQVHGRRDLRSRPHHRLRRREQPVRKSTRTPIGPPSTCASAASSGSALKNSSTPSPSLSRRPSSAGSRRTLIASTTHLHVYRRDARARMARRRPREMEKEEASRSAKSSSRSISTATRCCRTRRICAARRNGSVSRASSATMGALAR